jgi:hypothetical protein
VDCGHPARTIKVRFRSNNKISRRVEATDIGLLQGYHSTVFEFFNRNVILGFALYVPHLQVSAVADDNVCMWITQEIDIGEKEPEEAFSHDL